MATKKFLYQKANSEWVFGTNRDSICPAGVYRLEVESSGKLTVRHIYNRDIATAYNTSLSNFLKENGTAYVTLNELIAATTGFFSGTVSVNLEAGDLQIGAVELKDAITDTRAKIAAGSAVGVDDNALAVADANAKSILDALLAKLIAAPATEAKQDVTIGKMFPDVGIHVLKGTDPAGAGTYTGFYALEADTSISAITLTDTTKVTGTNDFAGITFQPGIFIEIPGGFSNITLGAGAMILIKA